MWLLSVKTRNVKAICQSTGRAGKRYFKSSGKLIRTLKSIEGELKIDFGSMTRALNYFSVNKRRISCLASFYVQLDLMVLFLSTIIGSSYRGHTPQSCPLRGIVKLYPLLRALNSRPIIFFPQHAKSETVWYVTGYSLTIYQSTQGHYV